MVDHEAYQLAVRAAVLSTEVCTTGAAGLGATAAGGNGGQSAYTRSSGSFVTDGFEPGMELRASGFPTRGNNTRAGITHVTATVCTVAATLVDEAEGAGRIASASMPALQDWENEGVTPEQARPYMTEQYLPGPPAKNVSLSPLAQLEVRPAYVLLFYAPSSTGRGALAKYARTIERAFPNGYQLSLSNGDVLNVRGEGGVMQGQLRQAKPGWAVVPVTIFFWLRTANLI